MLDWWQHTWQEGNFCPPGPRESCELLEHQGLSHISLQPLDASWLTGVAHISDLFACSSAYLVHNQGDNKRQWTKQRCLTSLGHKHGPKRQWLKQKWPGCRTKTPLSIPTPKLSDHQKPQNQLTPETLQWKELSIRKQAPTTSIIWNHQKPIVLPPQAALDIVSHPTHKRKISNLRLWKL